MSDLTQHLQDCIIQVAIEDTDFLRQIRPTLESEHFTARVTMEIMRIVYGYYDLYKEAPKEHFLEEMYSFLDKRKAKEEEKTKYELYLSKVYEIQNPNKEYLLTQIDSYIKKVNYMRFAERFAELIVKDRLDEAEGMMYKTLKTGIQKTVRAIDYFEDREGLVKRLQETEYIMRTGIPKLDHIIGGLERKTYVVIMAPEKGMKSWFLVHLGSQAITQGLRVVHFTHEMSAEKVEMRYDQNLLGLPKYRSGSFSVSSKVESCPHCKHKISIKDRSKKVVCPGCNVEIDVEKVDTYSINKNVYEIGHIIKKREEVERFGGRLKIIEYPTGTCSPMKLENDLERMQNFEGFIADVVITDYGDIMDSDYHILEPRHKLNEIAQRLRSIASDRNILILDAAQGTRQAQGKSNISMKHISEDKRRLATCDLCLGLAMSDEMRKEKEISIFIVVSREVEGNKFVTIRWNLDLGQFYEREV